MADAGTTRTWTRQVAQVMDEIEQTGRYLVREEYVRAKSDSIADYYLELYRWLTNKCRQHAVADIPADATLPIWLSMTEGQRLPAAAGTVSLTLDVPNENLFVLDYERWGYRVNDWYLPADQADEEAFKAELARVGIGSEASLITSDKGNFYPHLKQKMTRSWDRLFDGANPDMEHNVGVVWEIRPEWVVGVERYE